MGYKSKLKKVVCSTYNWGPSWSYGSWINNYIYNQCLSPLTLWVRILLRRGILDATLCDKVCQRLATGRWFSPPKTYLHDIAEILLKVAQNTIPPSTYNWFGVFLSCGWLLDTVWRWRYIMQFTSFECSCNTTLLCWENIARGENMT
jgi:hypothetical protein